MPEATLTLILMTRTTMEEQRNGMFSENEAVPIGKSREFYPPFQSQSEETEIHVNFRYILLRCKSVEGKQANYKHHER